MAFASGRKASQYLASCKEVGSVSECSHRVAEPEPGRGASQGTPPGALGQHRETISSAWPRLRPSWANGYAESGPWDRLAGQPHYPYLSRLKEASSARSEDSPGSAPDYLCLAQISQLLTTGSLFHIPIGASASRGLGGIRGLQGEESWGLSLKTNSL